MAVPVKATRHVTKTSRKMKALSTPMMAVIGLGLDGLFPFQSFSRRGLCRKSHCPVAVLGRLFVTRDLTTVIVPLL